MAFVPRTSPPIRGDLNFISRLYGFKGRNGCIPIDYSDGWVMPNCTGYAWGRFSEILGEPCKLSASNARNWYNYKADGYSRGGTPQLGAVICWYSSTYGHVAIVERINSDNSILTSESNYSSGYFKTRTLQPPNYRLGSSFSLQGFIYNPGCKGLTDKLSTFLEIANSKVGSNGYWAWSKSGQATGGDWCTSFIVAVAKETDGILSVVIPNTFSSSEFGRIGEALGYGRWYPGPHQGRYTKPEPGDIISFRWKYYSDVNTYFSDHLGIVYKVDNSKVYTIEGDVGSPDNYKSSVQYKDYSLTSTTINGYYRPNWAKVGANVANLVTNVGPLYEFTNTRKDALIRQVGYMNGSKPSISTSGIQLSVVNYTTLLNAEYEVGMPDVVENVTSDVDASGMNATPRSILEFFMNQGLNAAACCGILGNIQAECSFNIGAVNSIGASGMCQWLGGRKTAMIQTAGPNWKTNLTGQCQYLWNELCGAYKNNTLIPLQNVSNTLDGALEATNIFLHKFEVPCSHGRGNPLYTGCPQYRKRSEFTTQHWNTLVPVLT